MRQAAQIASSRSIPINLSGGRLPPAVGRTAAAAETGSHLCLASLRALSILMPAPQQCLRALGSPVFAPVCRRRKGRRRAGKRAAHGRWDAQHINWQRVFTPPFFAPFPPLLPPPAHPSNHAPPCHPPALRHAPAGQRRRGTAGECGRRRRSPADLQHRSEQPLRLTPLPAQVPKSCKKWKTGSAMVTDALKVRCPTSPREGVPLRRRPPATCALPCAPAPHLSPHPS